MQPIYSTRFLAAVVGSGATYTVPAGDVAVVRCVTAFNSANTTSTFFVGITGVSAAFIGGELGAVYAETPQPYSRSFDLRVVVKGGEELMLGGTPGVLITISGYLFAS